ncbi:MAG: type VII secretion target [Mycobacterium sp.]|nr:type VII secretion target [Mycobacterium sp.]
MSQGDITVSTAQVRLSADQMAVVSDEASASRAAVADSVSTQRAAWKEKGGPGFGAFVDVLEAQAERLRTDLTALADSLHAAADVYDRQDQEAGAAVDSAVRYR